MHPIAAALSACPKPSAAGRAAPLHLPPASLLVPAACWDIHRPLSSLADQCCSVPILATAPAARAGGPSWRYPYSLQ